MEPLLVSCNCGAVALEIRGEPLAQFYCHCDDCQAVHGGAYVPVVLYPADAVRIVAGEVTTWARRNTPRTSCRVCGTRVLAEPAGMPARSVMANLLPPERFRPDFHVQCQHARAPVHDGLPHFKGYPAAWGGSDDKVTW